MSRSRQRRRSVPLAVHRPAAEFARALGYRFRKVRRLEEALTHGSYRNDHDVADYERLEFLGDAALGLVVTEAMHFQRPGWPANRRQDTKSEVVSNQSLAGAARSLSLEEGIRVGRGRSAGEAVRSSDRILANVFEAVLGAAYLDGGIPAARGIVGTAFRREFAKLGLRPPAGAEGWWRRSFVRLSTLPRLLVRAMRRLLFSRSSRERSLRYTFASPPLLRAALDGTPETPRRSSGSRRGGRRRGGRSRGGAPRRGRPPAHRTGAPGQQALRFLGRDAMHLVVADALHRDFPDWDEGRLTLARMRLQEREFTTRMCRHWSLEGETAAAEAEAIVGALYLDGRLPAVRRALGQPFREALEDLRNPDLELLDPKTLLQNRLAQSGREAPRYEIRKPGEGARQSGEIAVTLRLENGIETIGRGRGLKEAEKDAAGRALDRLDGGAGPEPARERRSGAQPAAQPVPGRADGSSRPAAGTAGRPDNPKGALQEALVKQEGRLPVYRLIAESGPDHEKNYVVEVLSGQRRLGTGSGRNKRTAEAEAAAAALESGI